MGKMKIYVTPTDFGRRITGYYDKPKSDSFLCELTPEKLG